MHGIGDVYWKYVTSYPLGVAIANFMVGVPIDESKMLWWILAITSSICVTWRVMFLLLCIVHGLQFLTIRTTGKLRERARIAAIKIAPFSLLTLLVFAGVGYGKPTFSLLMEQNGLWYQSELCSTISVHFIK